jgi:hypothetical protein
MLSLTNAASAKQMNAGHAGQYSLFVQMATGQCSMTDFIERIGLPASTQFGTTNGTRLGLLILLLLLLPYHTCECSTNAD